MAVHLHLHLHKARLFLGVFLITAGLLGCSTTTKQQPVEAFADAGLNYTKTARAVNKISQEESLNFSADLMTDLPRDAFVLKSQSQEAMQRVKLLEQQRDQLDLLEQYFALLNTYSKGKGNSKTEQLLADLVYALKGTISVTRKESKDFSELGLKVQGRLNLQEVIERDREVIAASIEGLANSLAQQAQWLELRHALIRQRNFQRDVEAPFVNNQNLTKRWKKAWINSVMPTPALTALQKAQQVTESLLHAWNNLYSNSASRSHLNVELKQLNNTLAEMEQPNE